MHGT
ncbi:hypothetical protein SAMN04488042_1011008 [Shimia aestuarii]|jgi:hypothetical protein